MERRLVLLPVSGMQEFPAMVSRYCDAPAIPANRYTLFPGETSRIEILTSRPVEATVTDPAGADSQLAVTADSGNVWTAHFTGPRKSGNTP